MQKIQLEKSLSEGFIFYAISTLTIAIQFLFYLIHSPRLAMMDVGGWMFYITAACSHAALWALIPYIISLIVAITVRRHQAAAITHIILVSLLNILAYIDAEGCNLTATELHLLAIRKAMSMYDKLLGISSVVPVLPRMRLQPRK